MTSPHQRLLRFELLSVRKIEKHLYMQIYLCVLVNLPLYSPVSLPFNQSVFVSLSLRYVVSDSFKSCSSWAKTMCHHHHNQKCQRTADCKEFIFPNTNKTSYTTGNTKNPLAQHLKIHTWLKKNNDHGITGTRSRSLPAELALLSAQLHTKPGDFLCTQGLHLTKFLTRSLNLFPHRPQLFSTHRR